MDAMDALPPFEDLVASVLIHLLQVALVMDAMDVHDGFLSEQQFRDIVEAEAIVSHSQVVEIYRHRRHDRPAWWSTAPAGKGSMLA